MAADRMQVSEAIRKQLEEHGEDLVREMLSLMAQLLMDAQVEGLSGTPDGRGSPTLRLHRRSVTSPWLL